jgi:hypothetical protein
MTKPTIRIHNSQTNEVIDREMTAPEFAKYEAEQNEYAKREALQAAAQAAKTAAQTKLEALGFTADDLKALGL